MALTFTFTNSSGVQVATTAPPFTPPSGPQSIASTSCSITTTLWPPSTKRYSTRMSFSTSAMLRRRR
jgi:hypothetical protein